MRFHFQFLLLVFIGLLTSTNGSGAKFTTSVHLASSIFNNFYCGNVDGFPHFKRVYSSECIDEDHHIFDREFWNDGASPCAFLQLHEYMGTSKNLQMNILLEKLILNWNYAQIRNILLWDKVDQDDRYGVGNDDRLWYAITFIRLMKITTSNSTIREQFKSLAYEIFEFVTDTQIDDECGGGVYWDQDKSYKNSITNHLYIDLAVYLFEDSNKIEYIQAAKSIADWELSANLLNPQNDLFSDGADINHNCNDIDHTNWSYNQGVFMRGYLAISEYYLDEKYENIVKNTIKSLALDLHNKLFMPLQYFPERRNREKIILMEQRNVTYDETRANFKGVYMRYLGSSYLHFERKNDLVMKQLIEKYVTDNAEYVYPLFDPKNSYPFYWNQNIPYEKQNYTSTTTITTLDLFGLYDYIQSKKTHNIQYNQSNQFE